MPSTVALTKYMPCGNCDKLRNAEIITSRFERWLLATPNLRFPPDFPQLLSVGAIAFVGHVALATLPSCALSAGKIPTPKTRTYYCDVPNAGFWRLSDKFCHYFSLHINDLNKAFFGCFFISPFNGNFTGSGIRM